MSRSSDNYLFAVFQTEIRHRRTRGFKCIISEMAERLHRKLLQSYPELEGHRYNAMRSIALVLAFWLLLAGCQSTSLTVPSAVPVAVIGAEQVNEASPLQAYVAETRPVDVTDGANFQALARQQPAPVLSEIPKPTLTPEITDLWSRIRAGMALTALNGASAKLVATHVEWYRQHPDHITRTFTRSRLYLYDIVEAVERQKMPMEIALLPAVESAFIPAARSSAAADGLWQFMALTGRRFNLQQHMFQDDRRNVRAATNAALAYLKQLSIRFKGNWNLAIASYNCGENCIERHRARARKAGLEGRFEDLNLNAETANYVPRLQALALVVADPQKYGITLPAIDNAPSVVAVAIHRDMDVALAARMAGLSIKEFNLLNPQHKKPIIVAASNAEILVPLESEQTFIDAMQSHHGPLATWSATKVKKRSSVEMLARQHHINPTLLRETNGIAQGHLVLTGSTLLVPRNGQQTDLSAHLVETASVATTPAMVERKVVIGKKDAWPKLAARFGVSVNQLQNWNPGVKKLRRGVIVLRLPVEVAERVTRQLSAKTVRGKASVMPVKSKDPRDQKRKLIEVRKRTKDCGKSADCATKVTLLARKSDRY